jgi:hypothetical protein
MSCQKESIKVFYHLKSVDFLERGIYNEFHLVEVDFLSDIHWPLQWSTAGTLP